jgi:hypothetical protein
MTSDKIRELVKRKPFSPFRIYMNDGQKLDVNHPDFIAMHPEARTTVIVFLPKGRFEFVYLKNVTSIQTEGEVPPPTKPKKGEEQEE